MMKRNRCGEMSRSGGDDKSYTVKLRGLPWTTSMDDILTFLSDCGIKDGKEGIQMTLTKDGRRNGEAYVEMVGDKDVERACKKNGQRMGQRYIEVFKVERSELEWKVRQGGLNLVNTIDNHCVRVRGLPFACLKGEIAQFFSGLLIVSNGISLPTDRTGQSTGQAFVQFVNKEVADQALQRHKDIMGHRYIEVFPSTLAEFRASMGPNLSPSGRLQGGFKPRPTSYDRLDHFGGTNRFNSWWQGSRSFKGFSDCDDGPTSPWGLHSSWSIGTEGRGGGRRLSGGGNGLDVGGGGGRGAHNIHMRGLPYRAKHLDIIDFFRPSAPINIRILLDGSGRSTGEADVEFATHDEAVLGMSKHKGHIQHRYIELFLHSTPSNGSGDGLGGGHFGSVKGSGFSGGSGGGFSGGGVGASV